MRQDVQSLTVPDFNFFQVYENLKNHDNPHTSETKKIDQSKLEARLETHDKTLTIVLPHDKGSFRWIKSLKFYEKNYRKNVTSRNLKLFEQSQLLGSKISNYW